MLKIRTIYRRIIFKIKTICIQFRKFALSKIQARKRSQQRLEAIIDGYGAAICGLEEASRRHEVLIQQIMEKTNRADSNKEAVLADLESKR